MNADTEFLCSSPIIDWDHSAVLTLAKSLGRSGDSTEVAKRCFEWVRDEIQHSGDFRRDPTTCRASDVLQHRTGFCYAKSHLLAALLRANGLPAGLCYQRLSVGDSGPPYCLHGFSAVKLPGFGWYRIDARGNRNDVDAQFRPPVEQLAFQLGSGEEVEFENIFPEPLDCVVQALQQKTTWQSVLAQLPDVAPSQFADWGLAVRRRGGRCVNSS